jgi:very-short-patch-repair endonuclease
MSRRGEALVAILRTHQDFAIAREQGWYRIPVESAQRILRGRWPPEWLAFYQTKTFGGQAHAVNYLCKITGIDTLPRRVLFPESPADDRSERLYYRISFDRLEPLPKPIPSRRLRRIVFIPTTLGKVRSATEINDLFDDSPLEDDLWRALKQLRIPAQRQDLVRVGTRRYFLDFAIYCARGSVDIETDGDTWHVGREKAPLDNLRDNDLRSAGWALLRFTTRQIREEMGEYCVPKIADTVNNLGGIDDGTFPRMAVRKPGDSYQLSLLGNDMKETDP